MVFLVTFKRFPFACGNAGERYALTSRSFDVMERTSLPAPYIIWTLRASGRFGDYRLLTQSEAVQQRAVTIAVRAPQVIQKFAPPAHHSQQPAAGVMVLNMVLEVIRQIVNARGK